MTTSNAVWPHRLIPVFAAILYASAAGAVPADSQAAEAGGSIGLKLGGKTVAHYVYRHDMIHRPFFAHVKAPNGSQVTRNFPPVDGKDRMDHATMHPGIWLAFGDLDGSDLWRNRGRVVHESFTSRPSADSRRLTFGVRNRYERPDGSVICREQCTYTLLVRDRGYLLTWDSTFSSSRDFYLGDQEEMGLGIRVATPISAASGGTILDSAGRRNGKQVWGHTADWCDYSGKADGKRIGMTIMCHPANFRQSWMHARDYGLIVANPFGRKAFGKGRPSRVVVKAGERFRLRYGILLHSGLDGDIESIREAYADYVSLARENK